MNRFGDHPGDFRPGREGRPDRPNPFAQRPTGPSEFVERRGAPRPFRPQREPAENPAELVCGHHAVESLLATQANRVQRLLLERGAGDPRLYELQKMAESKGIPVQQLQPRDLFSRAQGRKHQGVVAVCNAREFVEWTQLRSDLLAALDREESPIVLLGAAIEDPRNLGAIARTCVGLGVSAMILPRKGGCGLTPVADEASAGALAHLPVARPADLESVLRDLKDAGFEIVGLDARGEDIRTVELKGPLVLVAGGEDRGIPPHLRRPCSRLLRLPMDSKLQSYNASVAAAMALYEIARNR